MEIVINKNKGVSAENPVKSRRKFNNNNYGSTFLP